MLRLAAVAGSISSTSSISPLEEAVQILDVGFVEVELGRGGRDLSVREHADPLAACDQTLDLFKLLKFRY